MDTSNGLKIQHDQREEHQRLAAIIKDHHKQLRREYRETEGDYSLVWEHHTQDVIGLRRYAEAMHILATQHWAVHPDTRVSWCIGTALDYFRSGGMRRALEKDARRRRGRKSRTGDTDCERPRAADKSDGNLGQGIQEIVETSEATCDIETDIPCLDGRIRLLDVGSCYNPFMECPEFESIGVDLTPATDDVYQCDFLKLEVVASSSQPPASSSLPDLDLPPLTLGHTPEDGVDGHQIQCKRVVKQLPAESFHVVVFSLLLEYLPASDQRWHCCQAAASLLVKHGLLLIVTPDSNSQHRNAPMMKSWRQALEYLGFDRYKYQKLEHVHCMAFRKIHDQPTASIPEVAHKLLYIPQDFSDACYWDDHLPDSMKAERASVSHGKREKDDEDLHSFLVDSAGELPFMDSDNDEEAISGS